jgi:hydrogenase small subunit
MGNPGYCTIAGDSILNLVKKVAGKALVNIAAGSCAFDGGIVAAAPNPTGATGLQGAVPNARNLINMPGCPVNGVNLVAAIVFWLTYKQLPPLDSQRRPLFAYGHEIHHEGNCERFPFYEADLFVKNWGDEGHKKGYCLKNMGCRGPIAHSNCYTRNWNQNTNWPIGAGHGCIGCTESKFWDKASNSRTGDKGSIYKVIDD